MRKRVVSGLAGWGCLVVLCAALCPAIAASAAAAETASHAVAGEPASHGGGHGSGDVNPMSFQSDLALWTGVVFVCVFLVLAKFAWGPISEGLEKREKFIADQIAQAEKTNEDSRKLLAEYQQKLAGSHEEVRAIVEQGRRDAEQVGRELIEKARAEAKREQEKAVRDIEQASAAAQQELAERSASLAVDLAGKIIGSRLQAADHADLIQQAVARFPQGKPGAN